MYFFVKKFELNESHLTDPVYLFAPNGGVYAACCYFFSQVRTLWHTNQLPSYSKKSIINQSSM